MTTSTVTPPSDPNANPPKTGRGLYNFSAAVLYIQHGTCAAPSAIELVLRAQHVLLVVLGEQLDASVDVGALRVKYPGLFHVPEGLLVWEVEAAFVMYETALDANVVVDILRSDLEYRAFIGYADKDMWCDYGRWAAEWTTLRASEFMSSGAAFRSDLPS